MMRVLVNGLSIGSLSGEHVVYGFLSRIAAWTQGVHEFVLLHYESSPPAVLDLQNVHKLPLADRYRPWALRSAWECSFLPGVLRQERIDLLVNPSGVTTPTCRCPQVVLAQNPWCFARKIHRGWRERIKAALQRRAYRRAMGRASLLVFISDYLRSLYRSVTRTCHEAPSVIAYPALDDSTHEAASRLAGKVPRDPHRILAVSAMAPWKGIETLVAALRQLLSERIPCRVRLVGPWPDPVYERAIRRQIHDLEMDDAVEITGEVSRLDLHHHYARARVFCLMSRCESFGIPAAEAQAFGTPVVCSSDCAIPEICGPGGVYGPPGDVAWTAGALRRMLTDEDHWAAHSCAALANVRRLRWDDCAKPLMTMFSLA